MLSKAVLDEGGQDCSREDVGYDKYCDVATRYGDDGESSLILVSYFKPLACSIFRYFCSYVYDIHKPLLPLFDITGLPLIEETKNLSCNVLSSGLLVIHYARRCCKDDISELTRRQQLDDPFLEVGYANIVSR